MCFVSGRLRPESTLNSLYSVRPDEPNSLTRKLSFLVPFYSQHFLCLFFSFGNNNKCTSGCLVILEAAQRTEFIAQDVFLDF